MPDEIVDVLTEPVPETTALAVQPVAPVAIPNRTFVYNPTPDTVVEIWPTEVDCIRATPKMIADLVCKGIPMHEAIRLLMLCRQAGINPFSGELAVKKVENGRGGYDYQFMIRQQTWRRLASSHPEFGGMTYTEDPNDPAMYVPPVRGVCTVWRKGTPEPYVQSVYYEEAITDVGVGGKPHKRNTGYPICQPREFLRGVTEARALRHVFPDRFSGFYDEGEFK